MSSSKLASLPRFLLVAGARGDVIPSEDVVPLHVNYLREKLNGIQGNQNANRQLKVWSHSSNTL